MKLKEYISAIPLLLDFPYNAEYVEEYLENMTHIDTRTKTKYGQLPLYYDNAEEITKMIQSVLFLNKYKYDGLYKTIKLEYNPIWNVEGTETTTTTHGATETSNVYADKETTNTQGERKATERRSVFPYDTTLKEEPEEPDTITEGTETEEPDNVTETEETNKTPKEETDNTTAEVTDKTTEKGRTDKTTTGEYVDTMVLDRRGNIGVTSTQNLIGQERDIVNFVFWDIVISDVVKEITIPFYEG